MSAFEVFDRHTARQPPARVTLTIGLSSNLGLSPAAMEALAHPSHVLLLYDRQQQLIGIRATNAEDPRAFTVGRDVRLRGPAAGHISGQSYCRHYNLLSKRSRQLEGYREGDLLIFPVQTRPPQGTGQTPNADLETFTPPRKRPATRPRPSEPPPGGAS